MPKHEKRTCEYCGKSYQPRVNFQKYCSEKCKRKVETKSGKYRNSTLNHLSASRIGDISELEASAYYLREGYEVFRNVSSNGPADIIIWKPETGEIYITDIKTFVYNGDPTNFITRVESESKYDVRILPYNYNTKQILRGL